MEEGGGNDKEGKEKGVMTKGGRRGVMTRGGGGDNNEGERERG